MNSFFTLLRAAVAAIVFAAGSAWAHEGHDHGVQPLAPATAATPRMEARSGPFELVAVLRGGELVIYLDRVDTNAPITNAAIEVETPAGTIAAKNHRDETYRVPAPWAQARAVDLIFTVTMDESVEVLSGTIAFASSVAGAPEVSPSRLPSISDLGDSPTLLAALASFTAGIVLMGAWRRNRIRTCTLIVATTLIPDLAGAHEGHDHGAAPPAVVGAGEVSQRLADATLFVPKPVQRVLAIRTLVAAESVHAKTVELPGRIMPDPNASGFVQASVSGRLSPPSGGFPKLGTAVKAGDVLAFVTPPFQAIDVSDMRQKAGEIDQQITIVEQRVSRYEPLVKTGAVTRVTYDEAMLELKGLRERRASLDTVRADSERLVAPVAGVIASANAVTGQIAETNAVVFQIIDPTRLWVEALTFAVLPDAQAATARTGNGRSLSLKFQGAGLTDRSQAIPVHFAIHTDAKGLRVGQLVTVLAATGEETRGLALPRSAALRTANGQTIVYEHTAAESFAPRSVRIEPLDADRVVVLDGIAQGARIVVQGAELLNQVR